MQAEKRKLELLETLGSMSAVELKKYAKTQGIKLHTTVQSKMLDIIASIQSEREFHGEAFWYAK